MTTNYRKVVRGKQILIVIYYKILSVRCTERQWFLSAGYKHAIMVWCEQDRFI